MPAALANHRCNAYCRGDEHCDLVYTNARSGVALGKRYAARLRVAVTRIQPAREAPSEIPPTHEVLEGDGGPTPHAWLIWWRLPDGQWQPPTQGYLRAITIPLED